MKDRKSFLIATLLVFSILAVTYFIRTDILKTFLPAAVVKYRIIGPLATLTLAGTLCLPWQMTLAMAFSLTGDFMGAYGSFIGQMGFFALAHIMLITYFTGKLRSMRQDMKGRPDAASSRRNGRCAAAVIIAAALLVFALLCIVPHAPAGVIRIGCTIYAALICSMFSLAMMQHELIFAAGATLFLFSDMILSWNKFVCPIAASKWLIMVPYYAGQLLIWCGAFRKNSGATYR